LAATVARCYAQALLEAMKSPEQMEVAEADLTEVRRLLVRLPALIRVLSHPGVDAQKRKALLDQALESLQCLPETRRLLAMLQERRRLGDVAEILEAYRKAKNRKLGLTAVEVTTSTQIAEGEKAAWEAALAKIAGTSVRVEYRTDESLIGGAVARVGSVLYDGSVRGSLERIRQSLLGE